MRPFEIIKKLQATTKRTKKEEIIAEAWQQGCFEFFEGAKLAYDNLTVFGVKKLPYIENVSEEDYGDPDDYKWEDFISLARKLSTGELTGNAARDALLEAAEICHVPTWNLWYRSILAKDLRCGITDKTINTVLKKYGSKTKPYLVPVFGCQLAKSGYDNDGEFLPKVFSGEKYLDVKLDGTRVLTVLDKASNTVKQYSRRGKELVNFTEIKKSLQPMIQLLPQSMVLDGEVISRSFQELMTQLNRKENVDTSDAKLALFDVLPLEDFKRGECKLTQEQRHNVLLELMPMLQRMTEGRVYVIPKLKADLSTEEGRQMFNEFNMEVLESGAEGVMVKDPNSPYECKRKDYWLKIKPYIEVTLKIVDVEKGEKGKKYEDVVGNIVCEGYDLGRHIHVNVSSGIKDEWRAEWLHKKDDLVGQLVEIRADGFTEKPDENGRWSLRFPRFKTFRGFEKGEKL